MKTMKYDEVQKIIARDDRGKKDLMVEGQRITMNNEGQLVANRLKFEMSDNAMYQTFSRVGMPTQYEKRLLEINPRLVADQYNFFTRNMASEKEMLLRYREQGSKRILRAMLSEAYTPLDNAEVFETLRDIFGSLNDLDIESFYQDDNRARMRVIIPDLERSVGKALKKDDILRVGFDVINSEVGRSSLQISPVVFRLVCLNGLKMWQNEGDIFKQRHAYAQVDDLKGGMTKAIENAIKNGDVLIGNFVETKEKHVASPMDLIQNLAKKKEYSEKFAKQVQDAYLVEPEKTLYGVINAFTRASQKLDDETRIDVEKYAGSLVKMLPSTIENLSAKAV